MIEPTELEDFLKDMAEVPVVDVRSEDEFAHGHIPGSINVPLLTNEHRVQVGTLYKQMGKEAAVLKGFQLAGPRFYDIFKAVRKVSDNRRISIYCWRGGMRSNIVSWMMSLSDYRINLLQGGYKSYRNYVHQLFARKWKWVVVDGKTGSGKTMLLHQLAARGEQVLDLEAIASHRGSSFGHIGLPPQPSVEHFENLIAWELRKFDPGEPIWVENESRFIGQVKIPDALYNQTRTMPVVEVERSDEERREMIWEEYGKLPQSDLVEATERLSKRLGSDRMKLACIALVAGDWQGWLDVLLPYYDKTYAHSRQTHTGTITRLLLSGDLQKDLDALVALKKEIWKK
jgi:tRNA 2-selenouridine synthase